MINLSFRLGLGKNTYQLRLKKEKKRKEKGKKITFFMIGKNWNVHVFLLMKILLLIITKLFNFKFLLVILLFPTCPNIFNFCI